MATDFRSEFDLDSSIIYLNSGTHSICPRGVIEATQRFQREYELNPTRGLQTAYGRIWSVQQRLARFFGARPEDLFMRTNVTQALNEFILGAKLSSKAGEILTTDIEYGAVANLCRYRAERDGLQLRVVPRDRLLESLSPRTGMIVVSHVYTGDGTVIPLIPLGEEARRRDALLVVDGAHAPGAIPLDFSGLAEVDFYGGNLHKWMMGPKGTAFGWVSPAARERLRPAEAGWTTYESPGIYADYGAGDRFTGRFLMQGCYDFAPFLALGAMLEFWERHGPSAIRARLSELLAFTESEMAKAGWKTISPAAGPERGPLLAYDLEPGAAGPREATPNQIMIQLLERHRVQVHVSEWGGRMRLRLSPHIYNTEQEITLAAHALAPYAR